MTPGRSPEDRSGAARKGRPTGRLPRLGPIRPLAGFAAAAVVVALGGWIAASSENPATTSGTGSGDQRLTYTDREIGVRFQRPGEWAVARRNAVLRVSSPDSSAIIAIASPTRGRFIARVARDTERVLRKAYRPTRVVARAPGQMAGLNAATVEIVGVNPGNRPLRILSAVFAGRGRTYSVQLFAADGLSRLRFSEAQAILRSLALVARTGGR